MLVEASVSVKPTFMRLVSTLCFVLLLFTFTTIQGQAIAPDWTATDLDGVEHTLSDYLNDGKHVVIIWSATWCPPCWTYHNGGTMETLWELYGPDGTDELMLFFLEPDFDTNTNCLYGSTGCNDSSMGDWVTGTEFPIINLSSGNGGNLGSQYGIAAYPTSMVISAETGQYWKPTNGGSWSQSTIESWVFDSFSLAVDGTATDGYCGGDGQIEVTTEGGYLSKTYAWSNGAGNTSTITDLEPGNYTVTVSDAHGYSVEASFDVGGPSNGPLGIDLVGSGDVSCYDAQDGALVVTADGGNGGYFYDWSHGATGSYQDNLSGGIYQVTVTDALGCETIEEYEVLEPNELILTNSTTDASCAGADGSIIATSFGGLPPYEYEVGDITNNNGVFNELAAGDYTLRVTDENGCEKVEMITIEGTDGPVAEAITTDALTCATTQTMISGEGSTSGDDISYLWTTEDGSIVEGADELTAIVEAAGTYIINVTDNTSGCVTTASVVVEQDLAAPTAMVAEAGMLNCAISTMVLSGEGSDIGDSYSYLWTTTDGTIADGAETLTPTIGTAGTYILTVMNTENGCTSTAETTVTLDDVAPEVTTTGAELTCAATTATVCADVPDGATAVWMVGGAPVEGACAEVDAAGSYAVVVTGDNGCTTEAEATVNLSSDLPQVVVQEPETITCTVTEVTVTATVEGNVEDFDIVWQDQAGTPVGSELTIVVSAAGTYQLSVTDRANGCTTNSMIEVDEVIVNPESSYELVNENGELTLGSAAMGDPQTFVWTVDGQPVGTEDNIALAFDENGTYTICLEVTNDCGTDSYCEDYYYVVALSYENLVADVQCYNQADGRIAVTPEGGEGNYEIEWTGPNGYTASELVIEGLAPGQYDMNLSDSYGYQQSGSFTISGATEIVTSSAIIQNESAAGSADGSVEVAVEGGAGDFTYLWSDGSTDRVLTNVVAGDYTLEVTDGNGCTVTFGPYTVSSSTAVADVSFATDITLYPVPAVTLVNIEVQLTKSSAVTVNIINAHGKLVQSQRFGATTEISYQLDVTDYPGGIYFAEITNGQESSIQKFMIVK